MFSGHDFKNATVLEKVCVRRSSSQVDSANKEKAHVGEFVFTDKACRDYFQFIVS